MISMVERKDIISAYEQTGSMRAVSIEPLRLYPSVEEDQGKGADIGGIGCRLPPDARQWRDTFTASLRPVSFQLSTCLLTACHRHTKLEYVILSQQDQ